MKTKPEYQHSQWLVKSTIIQVAFICVVAVILLHSTADIEAANLNIITSCMFGLLLILSFPIVRVRAYKDHLDYGSSTLPLFIRIDVEDIRSIQVSETKGISKYFYPDHCLIVRTFGDNHMIYCSNPEDVARRLREVYPLVSANPAVTEGTN
jgi:hypothetical protein